MLPTAPDRTPQRDRDDLVAGAAGAARSPAGDVPDRRAWAFLRRSWADAEGGCANNPLDRAAGLLCVARPGIS